MSHINFINQNILKAAGLLTYTVSDRAPDNIADLRNASSLVIWSGASDNTVFQCPKVNQAFRAIHDAAHLKFGLDFSHEQEIELGRIQASKQSSDLMRELIYCEVSLNAKYHQETGLFITGPEFTLQYLNKLKLI